jgi:YD repeat-containing protein
LKSLFPSSMRKKRIRSFGIVLHFKIILICLLIAQSSYGQPAKKQQIDFLAPQVADMMKYGNIQVPYYTGQSGYSIPLFQVDSKGFNIPISLNYNSEGFKPNQPTGIAGMNFYLSAAGAITRKVNGEPDEMTANCSNAHPKGFYLGIKSNTSSLDNSVWTFQGFNTNCGFYDRGFEYEPDEFTFNCLGHSGKFYFTYGGNVRVVSNEDVKVDLTNFVEQSINNPLPTNTSIVLTTADGYKFTFGGALNTLDYSIQMASASATTGNSVVTTWNLTKVTSPDGNTVQYNYKTFNSGISNNGSLSDPNFYILNKFYSSVTVANKSREQWSDGSTVTAESSRSEHLTESYSLTKTCYLASIYSDDFSLDFSYSQKAKKFYYNSSGSVDPSPYHKEGLQLDAIILRSPSNTEIKKVQFNYNYLGGGNGSRHLLTSLTEVGKGTYVFNYYRTNEFPSSYNRNIDHWGYWKGGYDDNASMIPNVSQDIIGDQVIGSTLRDADSSFCNVGLLQQVIYPTGGSTTFNYEAHKYAHRLERPSANNFMPQAMFVNGIAGGARIKSIVDAAPNINPITRKFKYVSDFIGGGTGSSGFLLDWPRYIYYWNSSTSSAQYHNLLIRGSSFHTNYNTNENYITYGEVIEEQSGNGYKVIKLNNYLSNPDYSDFNSYDFNTAYTNSVTNQPLYKNINGLKLNDLSFQRGVTNFEGYYNQNKTLVKSTATVYPVFNPSMPNLVSTRNSGQTIQAYKLYTEAYRPVSTLTVTNSSPAITDVKTLSYDDLKHNLRSESLQKSNGNVITKVISYPNDYASGTSFIDQLKTAGITGTQIEAVTYQTAGGNSSILSGQLTQYYADGRGRPQTSYSLTTASPIALADFKFSSRITGVLPSAGIAQAFSMDARFQPTLNYMQFDPKGNLLESITSLYYKGSPTAYKWGYNDLYPIAEVKNSKLTDVYLQDFELFRGEELFDPVGFEANLSLNGAKAHTGTYSGYIGNNGSAEITSMSSPYVNITAGTKRKFTYSGWVYSSGPSAQFFLFMYKEGESGYFSYVDNVDCYETGKWVYVTKTFQIPDDVVKLRMRLDNNGGGDVWFDDLAIRPAEAQLKTFTYYPFIGMRSKIEGNGQTTYYEYDNAQRLKAIKDQNSNILKTYDYHFSGQ